MKMWKRCNYFFGAAIAILILSGFVFGSDSVFAYTATVSTSGTVNVGVNMSGVGDSDGANVGTDNVVVTSTCPLGYTLEIAGPTDGTLYKNGDKTNSGANQKIMVSSGTSANPAPIVGNGYLGTWGYTTGNNITTSSNFIGLTSTANVIVAKNTGSGDGSSTTSDTIPVHYGISITDSMEPGTYKMAESTVGAGDDVIVYYLTVNANCNTYTLRYKGNGADSGSSMDNLSHQVTDGSEFSLRASNYKKANYGFAGWSLVQLNPDSANFQTSFAAAVADGKVYGPNESILANQTFLSNAIIENGVQYIDFYAVWVPSAGNLQNWNGCSSLAAGAVTALTDTRDSQVYAVAKLADGKCWMMENLRLNNTATINASNTDSPASGFSLNASQNPTTTAWCSAETDACINQGMLFSGNTTNTAQNPTSMDDNIYSYGNYYNFNAATAGNGRRSMSSVSLDTTRVVGSICPVGWHLPSGGNDTNTERSDFYNLALATIGSAPNNLYHDTGYNIDIISYANLNDGSQGKNASSALRKFPNNFINSGHVVGNEIQYRNALAGAYWSSNYYGGNDAFRLSVTNTAVYPGSRLNPMYVGDAVRCAIGNPNGIVYDANGADNPNAMNKQVISSSDSVATLWASNYKRAGYGFAGWSETPLVAETQNGDSGEYILEIPNGVTVYGPNETITDASVINRIKSNGIKLYAVWVKATEGSYFQDYDYCYNSNIHAGDVFALTDQRDNQTYAVAKLADGNCWMIENLRLDNQYTTSSNNIALAQGYASSSTYGNFTGLANAETAYFEKDDTQVNPSLVGNSKYTVNGSGGTINIGQNDFPSYRIPRYNNQNTNNATLSMIGADDNVYGYGNYYTWAAAIANTKNYATLSTVDAEGMTSETAGSSICPRGWHLPSGGDKTRFALGLNDVFTLGMAIVGSLPGNYDSIDRPYWDGDTEGLNAVRKFKAFPNNFVLSGYYGDLEADGVSEARKRGGSGYIWTVNPRTNSTSYRLTIGEWYNNTTDIYVYPGTANNYKSRALPVRCMADKSVITYDGNGADIVNGGMGNQTVRTDATEVTLWPSNYGRTGYGFAGWNTMPDGSGTNYGPNETITDVITVNMIKTRGLKLYANWVQSAGNIQSWAGCSSLAQGKTTALTDLRDNNTYAIAKLADGRCWMIENLRLDDQYTTSSTNIGQAQGYGENFVGLALPELGTAYNSTNSNSSYNTGEASTMPRYNNDNTHTASKMTSPSGAAWSYGNYYTWAAAKANISTIKSYAEGNETSTSICPKGWRLPYGSAIAPKRDYTDLMTALGGITTTMNTTTTPTGATMSAKLRQYPNNFLYSGSVDESSGNITGRGSYGLYWSAAAYLNSSNSTNGQRGLAMHINSTTAYPGQRDLHKSNASPVRCVSDITTISYNANGGTGGMANQQVVNSAAVPGVALRVPNFKRSSYGFAGWNTKADGTGTNFGPNEVINDGTLIRTIDKSGLQLYAKWVASSANMQNWTGCSSLAQGSIIGLKDLRDSQVYAVAKLADGKCWMVENLRLNNQYTTSSTNIGRAQGYGSGFIGLAASETDTFGTTTANSLYDLNATYIVPRYNNNNTASPVTSMTAITQNAYGYGNYYSWAAAKANITTIETQANGNNTATSICPKGWRLPYGGSGSTLDFAALSNSLGGLKSSSSGAALNMTETTSPTGSEMGIILRRYPNNFVLSGWVSNTTSTTSSYRGSAGYYWSAAANSSNPAQSLGLTISNYNVYPGTAQGNKASGRSVRCVIGS